MKVRGNLAYAHIKILREKGLISEEKLGRTKILKTTPVFADYFSLSSDSRTMKQQLQKMFEQQKSKGKKTPRKSSNFKSIIES